MLANRSAAGRELARAVQAHFMPPAMTIVGIVPGGIPIAAQMSARLGLPLDVAIVREEPLGLFIEGFPAELDRPAARRDVADIEAEVARQALVLRGHRPPRYLWGQTVMLVDDGTSSIRVLDAAIRLVRTRFAAAVILAVPTPTTALVDDVGGLVDDLIYLEKREETAAAYRENDALAEPELLVQLERSALASSRFAMPFADEPAKGIERHD